MIMCLEDMTHDMMDSHTSEPVKSVKTSIRIVETIEELNGASLHELSDNLDIAKSTVFDHVKTLEANEFLIKEDDQYQIGLRFLDHGGRARGRRRIYEFGKPEVTKLAEETGELSNLVVEEHGLVVYLFFDQGDNAVNHNTYIGKREYLHSTAVGKAMLAFMPEERVEQISQHHGLPQVTEQTVSTREKLEETLEEVRDRGYALDLEEGLPGFKCVAAPVESPDGEILGSISVSGPASRLDDEQLTGEFAEAVVQTANIIKINMTYS